MNALLSAEPCDPPGALPLAHRKPAETARELPNGRGFLRALPGGKGAPAAPTPEAPTSAPAVAAPTDDRQLDLLAWRPKPRPMGQLSLFGDEGGAD